MMRVIVTGSRWWSDREPIDRVLDNLYEQHGHLHIALGACIDRSTNELMGAGRWADQWAQAAMEAGLNVTLEEYRPDFELFGNTAYPLRNVSMVQAGVWCDVCGIDGMVLAWPIGTSPDTRQCIDLATSAGLYVENYGDRSLRRLHG